VVALRGVCTCLPFALNQTAPGNPPVIVAGNAPR
jgi:hypothetical protein